MCHNCTFYILFFMPLLSNFIVFSGTKHFLLMCNVRAEDSGEIKFVARHIESVAYLDVEGIISISKKYVLVV